MVNGVVIAIYRYFTSEGIKQHIILINSLGYNRWWGKRKSSFGIPVNCPFVYTIFDLTSLNKVSVRVATTYGLSIFCTYLWLYRIFCAEATEIKYFQINRYDNKTSSFEALENVWKNKILTSLWYSKLWFSKMPTTGFTHTNIYFIKLF